MQINKLQINKDKWHFSCTQFPFFGGVISRNGVKPDPQKLKAVTEITLPKKSYKHSLE